MATIASRIREAMNIRGMKQVDLVNATGIGKSSISTYLSGEYEPKQKNIYKIAQALDVNEAWLMGEDVPMDRTELDRVLEQAKIMSDENKSFLSSHYGVVYGDPERLQVGVSLWAHTTEDLHNAAELLMALTVLCRDQRSTQIKNLKDLADMISRLPSAKCEAIMDFAKYIAKSQED